MSFDDDVRDVADVGNPGSVESWQQLRGLMGLVAELGPDERAVIQLIAERLHMGQRRYGRLRLGTDRRDFAHDALEECADAAIYAACGLMRGHR